MIESGIMGEPVVGFTRWSASGFDEQRGEDRSGSSGNQRSLGVFETGGCVGQGWRGGRCTRKAKKLQVFGGLQVPVIA